ncbi:MAG: hypothetical protein JST59_02490 [Actinobacteria bacterium]|nr:hypothetical protein [Actinomycetota bacterium]
MKKQKAATGRLRDLASCIRGTLAKADSLSQTIKQRGKLAEHMLDAMMFRLLARQDSEGSDRQALSGNLSRMRELVKRNEEDIKSSLNLLQDELRKE